MGNFDELPLKEWSLKKYRFTVTEEGHDRLVGIIKSLDQDPNDYFEYPETPEQAAERLYNEHYNKDKTAGQF